jgi:chloride channel 7
VVEKGEYVTGFFVFLGFNLLYALVGTFAILFFEPAGSGSGMPEVKSYLNGIRVPKAFNIRTLLTKILGVICAVSSSLPVGPEGPMIHAGAMVGGGISQGKSKTMNFSLPFLKKFRNPRDRRDFISSGAAAGVSAAFGAPIGGILFSIEEASSFWSQTLTWRTFFGSMISTFTVNFFLSGMTGQFDQRSVILFNTGQSTSFALPELWPFVLIGVLGGFSGAFFTWINVVTNRWRRDHLLNKNTGAKKMFRIIEVSLIVIVFSLMAYLLCFVFGCKDKGSLEDYDRSNDEFAYGTRDTVQFNCREGQYNPMATLYMTRQEAAVKHLFSRETACEFDRWTLIVFTVTYLITSAVTSGTTISSGLMVPMLLVGAGYGRFIGNIVYAWFPHQGIDPGVYALIGASSFMGGVSRMTMSMTVILLEITNDMNFLLPIMLAIIVSKSVGDFFNHPLYDSLIGIKRLPYLEHEPSLAMEKLQCSDIMSREVVSIPRKCTVGKMLDILSNSVHNGFPVVDDSDRFLGMILKKHLVVFLRTRQYLRLRMITKVDFYEHLNESRNDVDVIRSLTPHDHLDIVFDLAPFMHQSPITVTPHFPVVRAFHIFRTMGLRHIPVIDRKYRVTGIISRKDMMEQSCEEVFGHTGQKVMSEGTSFAGFDDQRKKRQYEPPQLKGSLKKRATSEMCSVDDDMADLL